MSRNQEFAAGGGKRMALDRASGWGQSGKERMGQHGFGYLVRGSRLEAGDYVMHQGAPKIVMSLSHQAMAPKTAQLGDGSSLLVQPDVHYSVGDHPEHYASPPKKRLR